MPDLRYEYVMNTPFVGGNKETVKSSIEVNEHKLRHMLDYHLEKQIEQELN